jgi:uncharacterized membrane protein
LGGFILIIAPGILFFFWFMLSTEVVIIERVSGVAALQRSRQLMKGNMFKVFALLLLVGFINLAVDGGINFIPQRHVAIIVHAFVQGVTSVFAAAALVVFYYSCRCKFEDFDLLLLAQFVGEADPAEVSVGAEYGE